MRLWVRAGNLVRTFAQTDSARRKAAVELAFSIANPRLVCSDAPRDARCVVKWTERIAGRRTKMHVWRDVAGPAVSFWQTAA
jgi:hypothetical protein